MKFVGIIETDETAAFVRKVAEHLGFVEPAVIKGSPMVAIEQIARSGTSPAYILIEMSNHSRDILPELDSLAEYCEATTKVIVIGEVNDLNFYRQLLQRGVVEYFIKPVQVNDVRDAFLRSAVDSSDKKGGHANGQVIPVIAAASGDGATTIALNVGQLLATKLKKKTVVVDMDYQFGMLARNLDLTANYGLRELYDHPEGSIDLTLLERTLVPYNENLHIVSAPKSLRYMPNISKNMIANLIFTLRQRFNYVILDLPHVWSDWIGAIMKEADQNLLVAQLWLKSATHSSRLLDALQASGVPPEKTSIIINRSGSKFKEAITSADFAMACKKKVDYYISNDSKTIAMAENQGKTAIELNNSVLNKQFMEIANALVAREAKRG